MISADICGAVKCNSDPVLLKLLAVLGTGFDCASIEELRLVLSLGVHPSRIVFANPCKTPSALAFANQRHIVRTTFDNMDELDKIKRYYPDASLFLRIFADDPTALISLGEKFGAPLDSTYALLLRARDLGLKVIGVSFHIGQTMSGKRFMVAAVVLKQP